MQFRFETSTGHHHELEASDLQEAIEAVIGRGHTLEQITSVWYFDLIGGQWRSGDNLLAAYKAARNFKED